MLAGMPQRAHQRGIVHLRGVLAEQRYLGQRRAQAADVPAFDDGEVAPYHLAVAHGGEQRARRGVGGQRVLADLQSAGRAQLARQYLPVQPIAGGDALRLQLAQDAAEVVAALDQQAVAGADAGQRRVGEALVALPQPAAGDHAGQQQEQQQAPQRRAGAGALHAAPTDSGGGEPGNIGYAIASRACSPVVAGCGGHARAPSVETGRIPRTALHSASASADSTSPIDSSAVSTSPCPSSQPRSTPATPQRATGGVSQRPSRWTRRLAEVAQTGRPSASRIRPSSRPARSTSARANTCSSRLQCLMPASAGWIARRVSQACRRSDAGMGGNGCSASVHTGGASAGGAYPRPPSPRVSSSLSTPASVSPTRSAMRASMKAASGTAMPSRFAPSFKRARWRGHSGNPPRCTRMVSNRPSP